jgi:Tol biopolymer transport system component
MATTIAVGALLTLAVTLIGPLSPASASFGGAPGRIAYVRNVDNQSDIYTVNPDGSDVTRLTGLPGRDSTPAWSPDGARIAFESDRGLESGVELDIYVMNADGSHPTRLTETGMNLTPSWSPDGTKIVFTGHRGDDHGIFVMNSDGSGETLLLDDPSFYGSPVWSRSYDGEKIAFQSMRDDAACPQAPCNHDVFLMNADGSGLERLTHSPAFDGFPAWSPDGTGMIFASERNHPGTADVFNLSVGCCSDGPVTDDGGNFPEYDPIGGTIVYDGADGLMLMNADGSDPRALTSGAMADWQPLPYPSRRSVTGDYDGDGRTDVAVFRPSNGTWFVQGGMTVPFGTSGDIPVPADYDGDGNTDIAVFRPSGGYWFVRGGVSTHFGTAGDIPVPADYDGDGRADIAVFRPSSGTWFIQGGSTTNFGTEGDIPVPGDYNGDGGAEIAVFRPSLGVWFVRGVITTQFGTAGDIPVPVAYAYGRTDIAVFRPSLGVWFVRPGGTTHFGTPGDVPVPGDYDGDGRADRAVFRPSTGVRHILRGLTPGFEAWGTTGDIPLPHASQALS